MARRGNPGPFETVSGIYHDAETAIDLRVQVRVEGDDLVICDADGVTLARWPIDTLRIAAGWSPAHSLRLASGRNELARLMIDDAPFIRALQARLPHLREERIFDLSRLRLVASLLFTFAGAVGLIFFVAVPLSSSLLAGSMPKTWRTQVGDMMQTAIIEDLAKQVGRRPEDLVCTGKLGTKALERITTALTDQLDLDKPVTMTVLDLDIVNAFAIPGNHVIAFKGLFNFARNGDEVAGVLGHELAHVTGRHSTRTLFERGATPVLLKLLIGDFGGRDLALSMGNLLLNAKHSRQKEEAADAHAVATMAGARIDPEALAGFLERVAQAGGAGGDYFRWLQSHPAPKERALDVRANAPQNKDYEPILSRGEFLRLRLICSKTEKPFNERVPTKNRHF